MIELIFLFIFTLSFGGVLFILARKLPVLSNLPQNGTTGIRKTQTILDVEEKIKNIILSFQKQIILHKFLSWVKIMTLKVEIKVDHLLHNIRKKAQLADKNLSDRK